MIALFNKEEEQRIIECIREAENNTSGEIRVHLEDKCRGDIMKAAARTFRKLNMQRTLARNGVLVFLAPDRKEFAILGGEGINEKVGVDFWEAEKELMQNYFREGKFSEGICLVVLQVGERLKEFFPFQDDDINELPDDISYG